MRSKLQGVFWVTAFAIVGYACYLSLQAGNYWQVPWKILIFPYTYVVTPFENGPIWIAVLGVSVVSLILSRFFRY